MGLLFVLSCVVSDKASYPWTARVQDVFLCVFLLLRGHASRDRIRPLMRPYCGLIILESRESKLGNSCFGSCLRKFTELTWGVRSSSPTKVLWDLGINYFYAPTNMEVHRPLLEDCPVEQGYGFSCWLLGGYVNYRCAKLAPKRSLL